MRLLTDVWAISTMQESKLQELEGERIVPPHELANWRPAFGEEFPSYQFNHELVVLESFFRCGFNVPPSKFLLNILNHYKIELHLNPNSITMISVFSTCVKPFSVSHRA